MLINKIHLPKIIDKLARFDGRKKRYVPYPSILKDSDPVRKREIQLLSDLQTEWESLQTAYPGNIRFTKSFDEPYRQVLWSDGCFFSAISGPSDYVDALWLSWSQTLGQYRHDFYEQLRPLSNEGFDEFQALIQDKIAKANDSARVLKASWKVIRQFIDYQNQHYMLAEHQYPKIVALQPTKTNPLIINADWIKNGKSLVRIIRAVHNHWNQTTDYSQEQIIGWLLFSGMVYGGINEVQMLQGWLTSLLTKKYQPFINERIVVSPRFIQKRYGNEREESSEELYNTKQIVVDVVSQCWLMRYHQKSSQEEIQHTLANLSEDSLKRYLKSTLADVTGPLNIKPPTLSRFLYYASYYWELLDGADIDNASVGVMRGIHNTVGLVTKDFDRFLHQEYKYREKPYDLEKILKLDISSNPNYKKETLSNSSKRAEVRKSDLIINLTNDFKLNEEQKKKKLSYKPPTLIERVQKRCEQYTDMSEAILLQWTLSLLCRESPPANKTILKYIRTIGYEWLYFTMAQPLHIWSEEEFEAHYDDILEYKAVVRCNTTTVYAGNLLQRMHDFARDRYNLPPVTIQQSKNGRRVRAELVSPQAYRAIITQIWESVDILEREMFALLFILVYRTGMRKKELLGLKYDDIEGLKLAMPSVVIRPNHYRPTKTQSSIRRVPIFALLRPDELNLFNTFIQSNIGNTSNKFIFTLSSDKHPIGDHVPLDLLKQVLKDISLDDNVPNHTFHGFRHTAVSNLSLVLLGHPDLVQSLTNYDNSDVLRIKHGLLGEHIDTQDRWYALSGMMGHLSPQRSFEYYNHFATLMATYALSVAHIRLPKQTLCNITNFTRLKLNNNSDIADNGMVSIPSMRKLLFKNIIEGKRKSPRFTVENLDKYLLFSTEPPATDELFGRYGINRILRLLQDSDDKIPLDKAAQMTSISMQDASILVKRAYEVSTITTGRDKPRFVKAADPKITILSPLSIRYQSDLRLLSLLLNQACRLRQKSESDWIWLIEVCCERLSNSRAYISFTKGDKEELQRFMRIAKELLPLKYWLMKGNEAVLESKKSDKNCQGIRQQCDDSINTIHIGIASRDQRSQTIKWQYSPLLRFFVHMMLITDENLSTMKVGSY